MHWKQETERAIIIIIIIIILIIVIVWLHTGNISQANGVVQLFLTEMMPKTQLILPVSQSVCAPDVTSSQDDWVAFFFFNYLQLKASFDDMVQM